ncbi:MAG: hypothetical protein ABI791_08125 [Acidobacteriota bacterium]
MSEEATAAAESTDENSSAPTTTIAGTEGGETAAETSAAPENTEDVSYQAVEKEGSVTAIWEMQGQKHLRTIDPRSHEGKQILALFETAG